jgi:glycosyltransferase involved in cell wall biosynthesis
VLNVDTLEPRKNLGILVDAVAELPGVDFVQCGSVGWGMDDWIERVRAMPAVSLRGYVPDAELGSLYGGAVAAVFPSIYEGFHLPPLDAMHSGCPVIASDIPVHREVLGDAAVFVPCHDAAAWAGAIRRLLEDAQARARLADAGRRRVAGFSWDQSARALLGVIESAVTTTRKVT